MNCERKWGQKKFLKKYWPPTAVKVHARTRTYRRSDFWSWSGGRWRTAWPCSAGRARRSPPVLVVVVGAWEAAAAVAPASACGRVVRHWRCDCPCAGAAAAEIRDWCRKARRWRPDSWLVPEVRFAVGDGAVVRGGCFPAGKEVKYQSVNDYCRICPKCFLKTPKNSGKTERKKSISKGKNSINQSINQSIQNEQIFKSVNKCNETSAKKIQ